MRAEGLTKRRAPTRGWARILRRGSADGTRPGILLLGNYPPPFGGVPTHIRYLTDDLAERGWSVHVLTGKTEPYGVRQVSEFVTVYSFSKETRMRALLKPLYRVPAAERSRRFFAGLRPFLARVSVAMLAKKIILENDIRVISAYHMIGPGTLGAWLSEDLGLPLITTVFGEIYSDLEFHRQRIQEVRYITSRTSKWLSCSQHCARSVELLGLPVEVETLYYGTDVDHFRPDRSAEPIRRRYGIAAEAPVVAFVGRMLEEMGLGVLLDAIPMVLGELPSVRFLIAGARQKLTPAAERRHAWYPKNVFVAPDVPYEELPLYYAAANLVVVPSTNARACLGLSIVEAHATGKPVVGCDVGGTREVLVPEETGVLTPPNDPLALAAAMLALLRDPDRVVKMAARARERACAMFDHHTTDLRMEAILQEVLKG